MNIIETLVYSQDKAIVSKAKSLTINDKTEYEKIQSIFHFVHVKIRYDYVLYNKLIKGNVVGGQDAVNTLKKRKGVCKGKAALLTSLLLSQGIEARYDQGYVEQDSEKWGHAWTSVKRDGEWVMYDPTNGYFGVFTNYFKTN